MARPKNDHEVWPQRFPPGTRARIDAVLKPGETRADLVRNATLAELRKREKTKP